MTGDIDFEPYAEAFDDHYASSRGRIRLALLHEQVSAHLRELTAGDGATRILDIGGGAGQLGLLLAADGHEVTIVDPTPAMLRLAAEHREAAPADVAERLHLVEGGYDIARTLAQAQGLFDVVLCHAVAPYVDDFDGMVDGIVAATRPGGTVSFVVKNRDALAMRPALERRWADALAAFDAEGDAGGLGVTNRAHSLAEATDALSTRGADIVAWYGVRVFSDSLTQDDHVDIGPILPVEREAARRDPYRAVARLLHLVATKR